jgi:rhodanese-related sulfurtransferase
MIRQAAILLLAAALAGVLTAFFHPRAPVYRATGERSPLALSLDEVAERGLDEILWVDARTADAFASGHPPGAVHLGEDDWEGGFETLMFTWMPGQTLIVYCDEATCHASEAVAQRLRRELGIEEVFFLEGGWAVLRETGP